MIQVELLRAGAVEEISTALTPADAIFAGQTLYDEASSWVPLQGARRQLAVRFSVNGQTTATTQGRPR